MSCLFFFHLLFNLLLRSNLLNKLLPSVYQIVLILDSYGVNSYPDLCNSNARGDSGLSGGKQMLTVSSLVLKCKCKGPGED